MQIDQAPDDEALDVILDDTENVAIINCSRWPITKAVTMNTKTEPSANIGRRIIEQAAG